MQVLSVKKYVKCSSLSLHALLWIQVHNSHPPRFVHLSWQALAAHAPSSCYAHFAYTALARVFFFSSSDVFWIIISIIDIFISDAKRAGNVLVYFCFLCCLVGCFCSDRTKRGSCMK